MKINKVRSNWWVDEKALREFKHKCLDAGVPSCQEAISQIIDRINKGDIKLREGK